MQTEIHYTIKEAAEQSKMSVSWWRMKVHKKEVRYVKIGKRVFIPKSTIDKLFVDGVVEPEEGK